MVPPRLFNIQSPPISQTEATMDIELLRSSLLTLPLHHALRAIHDHMLYSLVTNYVLKCSILIKQDVSFHVDVNIFQI